MQTAAARAAAVATVEKVAFSHFFEFLRVSPLAFALGRRNPQRRKPRVFIRFDAHVVKAGINLRGCGPLTTPGLLDKLKLPLHKQRQFVRSFLTSRSSTLWLVGGAARAPSCARRMRTACAAAAGSREPRPGGKKRSPVKSLKKLTAS